MILNLFHWKDIFIGEHDLKFLVETFVRTTIMFIIMLVALRLLGKRGVKQLSVFELVVIIGLGSAAGDPMFYKEVGILPAVTVFVVIIGLYSLITVLVVKSRHVETLVEGQPICLMEKGCFNVHNYKKQMLADDEFFAELRLRNVSQLGQVKIAIIETSGEISVFFYEDEEVSYGLPILPKEFEKKLKVVTEEAMYSCAFCGFTEKIQPVPQHTCKNCEKDTWVRSVNERRIA